ncbi:MAG TPA: polysaccharide pyruvyl transferase CsaB, partial [Limnochordia bacterium]|nr:polysaccharide pyruvyl transferase CsaB [Limnochordia bacterium]
MRVVVSGYYGFGNTGDEAVLRGLITALRRAGSVEITVLSGNPRETRALHGVEAVDRYSLAAIWKA